MPGGGISNAGATGKGQRQTADLKSVSLLRLDCRPGDSMREIHGLRALLSHFRNEKNFEIKGKRGHAAPPARSPYLDWRSARPTGPAGSVRRMRGPRRPQM